MSKLSAKLWNLDMKVGLLRLWIWCLVHDCKVTFLINWQGLENHAVAQCCLFGKDACFLCEASMLTWYLPLVYMCNFLRVTKASERDSMDHLWCVFLWLQICCTAINSLPKAFKKIVEYFLLTFFLQGWIFLLAHIKDSYSIGVLLFLKFLKFEWRHRCILRLLFFQQKAEWMRALCLIWAAMIYFEPNSYWMV